MLDAPDILVSYWAVMTVPPQCDLAYDNKFIVML